MLLYLSNESLYRIDTIELIDGCYPRITYDIGGSLYCGHDGVRSPPPTEEYSVSDLNIEPALWGIILILDRVCVDIKRRRFSWATASAGKILDDEDVEDPLYRTHYADDERYEYDDNIDELFNLAEHLITISHSRTKSTRESQEEQSSLIRMLYCCILPKIQIYQKDLKKVEEAIKNQMSYITKIEDDIDRDSLVLDQSYKVLCKQQDDRLSQFERISSQKKCTKMFVIALHTDLQKRRHQLSEQIDVNQTTVQHIKADIETNGETKEKKHNLEEARKLSAFLDKILQRVLIATVDTVKEALESENFQLYDNEAVVLEYLQSKEMCDKQKIVAKRQMEKKVRATSILENLKRIRGEIITDDGVASATAAGNSGVRSTDVIPNSHVPEYQTLSERVAAMVNNPEHPLGGEFARFTTDIRESCRDISEGVESARGSSEKRKRNTPKSENGYLLVDNDGTLQEEYLIPLEKLCERIKNHCNRMAKLFLEQFNSSSDVLERKLQLCYEENFYNEVGRDITKVYEMAYKQYKRKMIYDLGILSTYPIDCLELGMKQEWWLDLFEKRRQATTRQRSVSNPIPSGSRSSNSSTPTPPESECSSTASSTSRSSASGKCTHASPKDQASVKEERKRSSVMRPHSLLSFIRRKSKDVIVAVVEKNLPDENRNSQKSCYDNYLGEKSLYEATNMSDAIETRVPNGTRDDEGKHGMCADNENEDIKVETQQYENELSKFAKYFGPSLDCLKDVFKESSVFSKLKCLTKSLTKVTEAVQELRHQALEKVDDEFSLAITADDLLPLMVLIMLQMDPADAASIVVELKMMQDLVPRFLSRGCHGYALVEFEIASKVLHSLCTQFDWSTSFSTSP